MPKATGTARTAADGRRSDRTRRPQQRDAAELHRLRDVGHRRPGAAGRARRPQAGPPPGPLRDVRRRLPAGSLDIKCGRVVGDVMGQYHPHGDSAIYDALVRLAQPWSLRYPLVDGQGNFGSPGNDPAAACGTPSAGWRSSRWRWSATSTRRPSTSSRTTTARPRSRSSCRRFPNLLVNGSAGIAVGMATNIPPHNLGEVAAGAVVAEHPEADREELLEALIEPSRDRTSRPGPDHGPAGIEHAYRTGRGRSSCGPSRGRGGPRAGLTRRHRTALPGEPRMLAQDRRVGPRRQLAGSPTSATTRPRGPAMRLVIELKHDAVAKVVLNNLYKHTQLQTTSAANMLALVDGVPRTLTLDRSSGTGSTTRSTSSSGARLPVAQGRGARPHPARLSQGPRHNSTRSSRSSALGHRRRRATGLMALLEIDEIQANAILDMQLRRLAALERQKIIDDHDELQAGSPTCRTSWQARPAAHIVSRARRDRRQVRRRAPHADRAWRATWPSRPHPRGRRRRDDHRGGYAKRTKTDLYRSQRRGGKGVKGAQLRGEDVVDHFFATTTHHWMLFFTTSGRVYRAKAYELPEGGRDAKGQHVANLLAFQPGEDIAQV